MPYKSKFLMVVWEATLTDCHNSADGVQLAHSVAFPASPGPYFAACSEAYLDATWFYESCVEMHDRMARNYWNLVEPCYSPCHCRIVAAEE